MCHQNCSPHCHKAFSQQNKHIRGSMSCFCVPPTKFIKNIVDKSFLVQVCQTFSLPGGSEGKNLPEMQKTQFQSLVSNVPREGNGNPLQSSCLRNPQDRAAWQALVHGVAESQTGPSDSHTQGPRRPSYGASTRMIPHWT